MWRGSQKRSGICRNFNEEVKTECDEFCINVNAEAIEFANFVRL